LHHGRPGANRWLVDAGGSASDKSDVVGTVLSGVCMVHCVTTPLLVSAAPAAASVLGGFHPVLLGGVALVGLWAFWPGFRRHRRPEVPLLAVSGLALLALAALAFEESTAETVLSLGGAALMMGAHLRNRALLSAARHATP
jgi:hypothetical protein